MGSWGVQETVMRRLVLGLVALAAVACGGSPTRPTDRVDTTVTIGLAQNVGIESAGTIVRFDTVAEDSRCPADANCVWQGRAVVILSVAVSRRSTSVQLASDPSTARVASVNDLRFEFLQLAPYPWLSRPTQPGEYVLTIHVVR